VEVVGGGEVGDGKEFLVHRANSVVKIDKFTNFVPREGIPTAIGIARGSNNYGNFNDKVPLRLLWFTKCIKLL
jgi:hypothetical protein